MRFKQQFSAVLAIFTLIWASWAVAAPHLTSEQQAFKAQMQTAIQLANHEVHDQRAKLNNIYQQWSAKKPLTVEQKAWLDALGKEYKVENPDFSQAVTWKQLLLRVDEMPPSLIMAQAINESGWGTSRFAKNGKNFFGRWCFKKGCGILPKHPNYHSYHELKSFPSMLDSVRDYIHNINTHSAYEELRELRKKMRDEHKPLSGNELAGGLIKYSERGTRYIADIRAMIEKFDLAGLDLTTAI